MKKIESYYERKEDLRTNKFLKKNLFGKNNTFDIGSPYNTNEYLMNINSSSFWNDENSEDSIKIIPSTIINLREEENTELNFFDDKEMESTHENSIEQNIQKRLGRFIIKR